MFSALSQITLRLLKNFINFVEKRPIQIVLFNLSTPAKSMPIPYTNISNRAASGVSHLHQTPKYNLVEE
jgi:hypothetical protein